jgi:hypothetical protein
MNMIVLDAEVGARVEAAFRDDAGGCGSEPHDAGPLGRPLHRINVKLSRYLEQAL